MFDHNDNEYLLRNLNRNNVILFLGSGFSSLALNSINENLPVGAGLSKKIWELLGYADSFDNSSLQDLYQALLSGNIKKKTISDFMDKNLLVSTYPEIYDVISKPYWYRLYTLNVDNLIEEIYRKSPNLGIKSFAYPFDEPEERDQSLEKIQLIHLNGKLPCDPEHVVFSTAQYAKGTLQSLPFYEQFVREYATRPTIFIGTELNEPLLWKYIESRKQKPSQIAELRPKSFLISRNISKPKQAILKDFNIVSIEAETEQFLDWIASIEPQLVSKGEVLKVTLPSLSYLYENVNYAHYKREFSDFANSFTKVPIDVKFNKDRSLYLLGAAPKWEDIINDYDAPRNITNKIFDNVLNSYNKEKELKLNFVIGSGGCGKSTVLRRLGVRLAQTGCNVYLTNSEILPDPETILNVINVLDEKLILLFDNAEIVLKKLQPLIEKLKDAKKPPILIVASRTNNFDRLISTFKISYPFMEYPVPNLELNEIDRVINVLDESNLLGNLKGMNQYERRQEFSNRANKQILVAMKEATNGRGFDLIIKDEFSEIEPNEAKILCLCTALATSIGYRITLQEFVGCSSSEPAEALYFLKRNLRDIVVESGSRNEDLMLRHKVIAEFIVSNCVTLAELREAFIRLLNVLAIEVKSKKYKSRKFNLYRDLINHKFIYNKFSKEIKEARKIYDSLSGLFNDDFLFWLQYGTLELIGGDLELAENYINQSDSLKNDDAHVLSAKGYLLLKKSIFAPTFSESLIYHEQGSKIILSQLSNVLTKDSYFYHIYCKQKYNWISKWLEGNDESKGKELEKLRRISMQAIKDYPMDGKLANIDHKINVSYLNLGINKESRPMDDYIIDDYEI